MRRFNQRNVANAGNLFGMKWSFRTILLALLAFWVIGFIIFFLYFHRNNTNTIQRDIAPSDLSNLRQELVTRQKLIAFKAVQDKHPDNDPIIAEKLMLQDMASSGFETDQLLFVAQRLKDQSHLPFEQRRIYQPIELPDLSKYSQPREVYDKVKSEFENAEWQP